MSRRRGQGGHIEVKGRAYYVRFWLDVAGQEKRSHKSVRICPVFGPGALTKPERERRAREIVIESGADSEEHFNTVQGVNLGTSFQQQAEWFLNHLKTRKRKPIKPSTYTSWKSRLAWIDATLGEMPLADVNNLTLKGLVAEMANAGLAPGTMHSYVQFAKAVVRSAINDQGEQIHPRTWNNEFIDLPQITDQRTPTVTGEEVGKIIATAEGQYQALYALLGGTGMRIGEALALQVTDICGRTITVRRAVWRGIVSTPKTSNGLREIDVHPSLAAFLQRYIGGRGSGFVFQTSNGKPISQSDLLGRSLHRILAKIGLAKRGFHAFRRFRKTHLGKNRVPEGLQDFWMGHANTGVAGRYDKVKEDVEFRTLEAERAGLGFQLPSENPIKEPAAVVDPILVQKQPSPCQPETSAGDQGTQGENR